MALTGKREEHPALMMYHITLLLLGLTILLGFIAVFVPWVQADVAPGLRVFSYPFRTCYVQTFSTVNEQMCKDNDDIVGPLGANLTGGNNTCKIFILVTIGMGFVGILGAGQVALSMIVLVFFRLWARPMWHATLTQIFLVMVPCCTTCSFVMFIAYAEKTCAPNGIWPVHGYSYGWILMVFATALSSGAAVTGFFALRNLKRYQLVDLDDQKKSVYAEEQEVSSTGSDEENQWHPQPQPASTPVHSTTESHTPAVLY